MSSTGANRESEGGTMKNIIDNPETKPQSHTYAENQTTNNNDQSDSNVNQGNKQQAGPTHANEESPGGTMKNVIDNPATKS